jgi:ribosomal protein S18 acetylase RimI-like enzyme
MTETSMGQAEARTIDMSIRAAEVGDAPAVAKLTAELWASELPQLLVAGKERTAAFVERQLLAEGGRRLRNNFVGECDGELVAVGAIATLDDPRPGAYRKGMVRDMVEVLGLGPALRLVPPVVRLMISTLKEERPRFAYLYNIVIAPGRQRAGYGAQLFWHLEREAIARGCEYIGGQVMDPKVLAFYDRFGAESWEPLPRGRIARRLGVPSQLVYKRMKPGA